MSDLRQWIGREEAVEDDVSRAHARGMLALLDRNPNALNTGDVLPHGWHWLYCNPAAKQSELGIDGHPARGSFLPPVPLPRRMWAGGSIRFIAPIRIGDAITRRSRVRDISEKQGRTGSLVIVTIAHEIHTPHGLAVQEEQQLVYRERGSGNTAPAPDAAVRAADFTESFTPSRVALFRFSALTFNGHRIHYDQPYTTREEGYEDLLVHAPLTALLLLDAAVRHAPGGAPHEYSYRAVAPLFVDRDILIEGWHDADGIDVRASYEGATCMRARLTLTGRAT